MSDIPPNCLEAESKSPKSVAFPVDAIVIYCIILVFAFDGEIYPPPNTPLKELETAPG